MANVITFELRGTKAMAAQMRKLARRMPRRAARALRTEAELVVADAKTTYVPRDLGTLANSGHVREPTTGGGEIAVRMVFGSAAAPYALAIHEHPSDHSPPSWQGVTVRFKGTPRAGAKYLERPLKARLRGMSGRIASRLSMDPSAP